VWVTSPWPRPVWAQRYERRTHVERGVVGRLSAARTSILFGEFDERISRGAGIWLMDFGILSDVTRVLRDTEVL